MTATVSSEGVSVLDVGHRKSILFVDRSDGVSWGHAQTEHYTKANGITLYYCARVHLVYKLDSRWPTKCPILMREYGTGRPWVTCWMSLEPWEAVK